jgi:hypothetical protein
LGASCQELERSAKKLPQAKFATRTGERRKGSLTLIAE